MGLSLQPARRFGGKIATLIAVFALVVQPMYGLVASHVANASSINVCAGSSCDHETIQEALNEANPGDTITVGSGTYTESLIIDKSISIIGAGRDLTTIKAPASFADGLNFISIRGAGVNAAIKNITLDSQSTAYKYGSAAISVSAGANATIENTTIADYGYNGDSNFAHGGIYVKGAGTFATIRNNTIRPLASSTGLMNGVVVELGANADIQNNTITGNWYYGASNYSGSGIGVWDNANETTVIKNNIVTGNQVGLAFVTDSPAALTNVDVTGIAGNNSDTRSDAHIYPQFSGWPWAAPSTVYIDSSNTANTYGIVMADGKAVIKDYNLFSNAQDAVNAVAADGTVKLLRDISVDNSILITKALTFDGNGKSVVSSFGAGATSQYSGVIEVQNVSGVVRFVANNNKAFRIHGEGSKTIQGPGSYSGLHGINVYNSNVELNKVTLSNNGKSGLNVGRNSNAVVNNITTLNNSWYGINVDKTTSGSYSTLTVNGTSNHSEGDKAHIFSDIRTNVNNGSVKVSDPNLQYVRYWDGDGYRWVLDLEKPVISLSADSYNPSSFGVTASDDQGIATIGYSVWRGDIMIGMWGQGAINWSDRQNFTTTWSSFESSATGTYLPLSSLEDGSYTIHATVTDARGKSTNATGIKFTVNNEAPKAEIKVGELPSGDTTSNKDIVITGVGMPSENGTDIKTFFFELKTPTGKMISIYSDKGNRCVLNGPNECSFNLTDYYDGEGRYDIRLVVTDQQGHRNDGFRQPWVNNTEVSRFSFTVADVDDNSNPEDEIIDTDTPDPDDTQDLAEQERLVREQAERERIARERAEAESTLPITPLATAFGNPVFPAGDTVIDDAAEEDEDEDGEVAAATTGNNSEGGDVLAAEDTKDQWSLVNMLLTIAIAAASLFALIGLAGKREGEKNVVARVLSIVPALGAGAVLYFVEDFSGPMGWVNIWTLLVGGLVLVQMIILASTRSQAE